MNEHFFEETRTLIEKGRTKKALEKLKNACQEEGLDDFIDICSTLLKKQSTLEREKMIGIVSSSEAEARSNKITWDTIQLMNQIKRGSKISDVAPSKFKVIQKKAKEKKNADKLKNISWLEDGLFYALSVCLLIVKKRNKFGESYEDWGTGFLVKTNNGLRIMTNNHVVKTRDEAKNTIVAFDYQDNRENKPIKKKEYIGTDEDFKTDEKLDYSLLKLRSMDEKLDKKLKKRPAIKIASNIRCEHLDEGQHLTIIQHPKGRKKEIALNENHITEKTTQDVFYYTDTEKGSSGSPVFNDDWEVVALHWGHREMKDENDQPFYNNGGTLIQKIKEDLATKGINLL